jgi:putative aldouronate transport system substrate-binding protein
MMYNNLDSKLINSYGGKRMMILKKKTLLALGVLSASLMLTVCSGNKDNGAQAGSAAPVGPARVLAEVPHPVKDPYEKYSPAVNVKLVHGSNDGPFWFPPGDSLDNNVYTRRYSQDLGINYSFLWTSPSSQSAEKFNLMFSSGDLPDFISVSRLQFEQLYSAGLLEDMSDAIVDYASDYLREHLVGDYADLLKVTTKNGR